MQIKHTWGRNPEEGNECRNRDFAEAFVFSCLSDEVQPFVRSLEKRRLENVTTTGSTGIHGFLYYEETGIRSNIKNCSGCCGGTRNVIIKVRKYIALLVENFLEAEIIQRMEWLTCSSDLNLIQHAWDSFGQLIQ
ncbi:hypothetical protein TNCV_2464641 [Trichonephila clavipes]|nr:hypothetical protein TNCV_2464641 [Trichonephila clavipes]